MKPSPWFAFARLLAGLCFAGCASAPATAPVEPSYELIILRYGQLHLDNGLTHEQVVEQLSSPERPDVLVVVRPVDVETYVWNPQRITLTRGGTQRLRDAVRRTVRHDDFALDGALSGRYFAVRVDGEILYGGKISEDMSPPVDVRFPAIQVEEIEHRLILHVLPVEMYDGLDPRLEGSIRCASLPLFDEEDRAVRDADPVVQRFRRILRDPRIEAVFARQGKLVPESPVSPELLHRESLDRLLDANRDVDYALARGGSFDLWAILALEPAIDGDRGTIVSLVSRQSNANGIDEALIFRREYRLVEKKWRLASETEEICPSDGLCWPPGAIQRPPDGAEEVLRAAAALDRVVASGDQAALDRLLGGRCEAADGARDPYDRDETIDRDEIKAALLAGRAKELGRLVTIEASRATVRSLLDLAGDTDPAQPRTWGIVAHRELVRTADGWRLCQVRWETATCSFLGLRGSWATVSGCPYRERSFNPCWPPVWEDPTRPGCSRHYVHPSDFFDGSEQRWRCAG